MKPQRDTVTQFSFVSEGALFTEEQGKMEYISKLILAV